MAVTVDCPPGPLKVLGDKNQLQQVLINLATNALDAMPEGGELTFTARAVPEAGLLIQVMDTGSGMPSGVRARIFEPFFTTKEVGKGTGLGLSLAYEIIAQHGGTIRVDSAPGKGTTFVITLPLAEERERAAGQRQEVAHG